LHSTAAPVLDDREIPQASKDIDVDSHRVPHTSERHPVEPGDVAGEHEILAASRNLEVVVRVRLTKPGVRLVGVVASELLVINAGDRFTDLSTMPYSHSTTHLSQFHAVEKAAPDFTPGSVRDAVGGVFPCWHVLNYFRRGFGKFLESGDDCNAEVYAST
jgi:hypothetical protein